MNVIDTAGFYGPEVADPLIAEALRPYPEDLVIATKVGVKRGGVKRGQDKYLEPPPSPQGAARRLEDDLRRLGLERLDLVYLRLGDGRILKHSGVPLAESSALWPSSRRRARYATWGSPASPLRRSRRRGRSRRSRRCRTSTTSPTAPPRASWKSASGAASPSSLLPAGHRRAREAGRTGG